MSMIEENNRFQEASLFLSAVVEPDSAYLLDSLDYCNHPTDTSGLYHSDQDSKALSFFFSVLQCFFFFFVVLLKHRDDEFSDIDTWQKSSNQSVQK